MSAIPIPVLPSVQLKRILYTTDLSDASRAALPFVSAIARRYGSQVFAAHIWAPLLYPMTPAGMHSILEEQQKKDAQRALEEVLQTKELAGIQVKSMLACGEPLRELKKIVQENRIELAIVSTHGRTGFRHLLMGSVAEELFRTLPCPVLTVGPNISSRFTTQREIRHILFPTDLSLESKAVFPYLAMLAAEYRSKITVLHVLPSENHRHPSELDEAATLKEEIHRMFCSQTDPRCQVHVIIEAGHPAERILAHSQAGKADLIGLGVHKLGTFSTHFRNTIPYKVILQAECPVLTAHYGDEW
jgi:nucleotide-binding universal stress UspA family protein